MVTKHNIGLMFLSVRVNMQIKLSIQPEIIGKPNVSMKQMGWGWESIEVDSWQDAFELMTIDGYATTCELWNENRKRENFMSRQIILIDIDKNMLITDLFNDDFYNQYGAGFYTSPSHTDEHHKFRICFVLEQALRDPDQVESFIRAIVKYFYPDADIKPTNAASYFNGTPNCVIKEFRNTIVPNEVVNAIIDQYNTEQEQEWQQLKQHQHDHPDYEYDVEFVESLLHRIHQKNHDFRDEYDKWLSIAWATCNTLGVVNGEILMMKYWPRKTKKHIQSLKSYRPNTAKHTAGTLVHLSGISKPELYELTNKFKERNNLFTHEDMLNKLIRENRKNVV